MIGPRRDPVWTEISSVSTLAPPSNAMSGGERRAEYRVRSRELAPNIRLSKLEISTKRSRVGTMCDPKRWGRARRPGSPGGSVREREQSFDEVEIDAPNPEYPR